MRDRRANIAVNLELVLRPGVVRSSRGQRRHLRRLLRRLAAEAGAGD